MELCLDFAVKYNYLSIISRLQYYVTFDSLLENFQVQQLHFEISDQQSLPKLKYRTCWFA